MILIFTGPVGSGKTTALLNWSRDRDDAGGILMPVKNGKRVFRSPNSGEEFPAEAAEGESKTISIGPFRFSAAAFERAGREITAAFRKKEVLIIDEIGPLELMGTGFSEVLRSVLRELNHTSGQYLILVVREGLIEPVVQQFAISGYRVVRTVKDFHI